MVWDDVVNLIWVFRFYVVFGIVEFLVELDFGVIESEIFIISIGKV